MKTKLLFVIDTLEIGGSEKSLISLLSSLDYNKFDVDLQLFSYGGELEKLLPNKVNLLPPIAYTAYLKTPFMKSLHHTKIKFIITRVLNSIYIRNAHWIPTLSDIKYWYLSRCNFPHAVKDYDCAIAYDQGIATYYVIDRVKAKRKIGWNNAIYKLTDRALAIQKKYFKGLDYIVSVSEIVKKNIDDMYPEFSHKNIVINDIINANTIKKLAEEKIKSLEDLNNVPLITTSARLVEYEKGFDILLDALNILHKKNIKFYWIILGEGSYRTSIENYINDNQLGDCVKLMGAIINPYPYIKNSTVYVQTSRKESYGLSLAEARILNVPIVTTAYQGYEMQMVNGKNGIVVPINAQAVADAIADLLNNPEKRINISDYQKQEIKGNIDEVYKFYHILNC